jgi:hypothetical protein
MSLLNRRLRRSRSRTVQVNKLKSLTLPSELRDGQVDHFKRMYELYNSRHVAIDTSCTGAGKTVIHCLMARALNLPMVVVCPSSVEQYWLDNTKKYGSSVITTMSYEYMRGTTRYGVNHELLTFDESTLENKHADYKVTDTYNTLLTDGIYLVFDEAHRLRNASLQYNAARKLIHTMLYTSSTSRCALLSATLFDKIEHTISFFSLTGIMISSILTKHSKISGRINTGYDEICDKCYRLDEELTSTITRGNDGKVSKMRKIIYELFLRVVLPRISSRSTVTHNSSLTVRQLACVLPLEDEMILDSAISLYDSDNQNIMKALTLSERSKYRTTIRLAYSQLCSEQCKVILFFNRIESIEQAVQDLSMFNPVTLIGRDSKEQRTINMNQFNENNGNVRVLITLPSVGGVGVNLDDKFGDYPRHTFYIPSYHYTFQLQSRGRICRADTASPSTFTIVYSSNNLFEKHLLRSLSLKKSISSSVSTIEPIKMESDNTTYVIEHEEYTDEDVYLMSTLNIPEYDYNTFSVENMEKYACMKAGVSTT